MSFILRASVIIFSAGLCFSANPASAYQKPNSHPVPKPTNIKFKVLTPLLIFPPVSESSGPHSAPKEIRIKNDEPVRPIEVFAGGSLAKFMVDPFDSTILPGDTRILKVIYTPTADTSDDQAELFLRFNIAGHSDFEEAKVPLYGEGQLHDVPAKVECGQVNAFGKVITQGTTTVRFTNGGRYTVHLTQKAKSDPFVLTFPGSNGPVDSYDLDKSPIDGTITYTPKDVNSITDQVLTVSFTGASNLPGSCDLKLSGLGKVASSHFTTAIHSGDRQIAITGAQKDETYEVWIDSIGPHGVRIASLKAPADGDQTITVDRRDLLKHNTLLYLTAISVPGVVLDSTRTAPIQSPDARVIGAYQQGGASGADASGRLFLDVDSEYPLGGEDSRVRLLGHTRIGSGAQSASAVVGTYVAGLAGSINGLTLNKVASVGEALGGFEVYLVPPAKDTGSQSSLALFAAYGLNGYLQSSELDQTFAFPANGTQSNVQLRAAQAQSAAAAGNTITIANTCNYAMTTITGVADNCQFVRFRESQPNFFQEGYVGLRAEGFKSLWGTPPTYASKALLSAGWGFNEQVGRYRRPSTVRLEGFLPFALPGLLPVPSGTTKGDLPIYIFGTAEFNYHRDGLSFSSNNYILLDDPATVKVAGTVQTASAGNTFVIQTDRPKRDLYSFGVGVDLYSVYQLLWGKK